MSADQVRLADGYAQAAANIHAFADHYEALAKQTRANPALLTFALPFAEGLRTRYEELAAYCRMVGNQADEVATAHAADATKPVSA